MNLFVFCLQQRSIFDLNKLVSRLSFAGLVSDISGADFVWVCHERCVVYLAAIRGSVTPRLPAASRFVPGATIETRLSKATQFRGEPLKNQQPREGWSETTCELWWCSLGDFLKL